LDGTVSYLMQHM